MRGKWHIENVECGMYGIWDVQDIGCWGCGMLGMWDVGDVGCWGCGMFGMWDVWDVGCAGCGMFGMWDVGDVECSGFGMFGMWDVGCGMLIYKMPSPIARQVTSNEVNLILKISQQRKAVCCG